MSTDLSDLRKFTVLDPAAAREVSPAEWNRSRDDLERVMDGRLPARRHRPVTGRRITIGLVAAAATALAGIVVVPVLVPSAAEKAVASWTPQPGELTGTDVLPQAKACAESRTGGVDPAVVTANQVVLAEQRGAATMLILDQGGTAVAHCLSVDDKAFASQALGGSQLATASRPVVIETMSSLGSGDSQYSTVVGNVDPSVTGIDLVLDDGQLIKTSVQSSWWGAWWPGPAGGEVNAFKVRVHTAGGTSDFTPEQLFHD